LTKVIADPPPKRMGAFTWFLILGALGVDMALVENPQAIERLKPRLDKRKLKLRRKIRPAGRIVQLTPDFYSRISRMGNDARSRNYRPNADRSLPEMPPRREEAANRYSKSDFQGLSSFRSRASFFISMSLLMTPFSSSR
jgi:hypothetical protein